MSREKSNARVSRPTSGELSDLLRIVVDEMQELLAGDYPDMRLAKLPPKKPPGPAARQRRKHSRKK